jgi:hypothetical protein
MRGPKGKLYPPEEKYARETHLHFFRETPSFLIEEERR